MNRIPGETSNWLANCHPLPLMLIIIYHPVPKRYQRGEERKLATLVREHQRLRAIIGGDFSRPWITIIPISLSPAVLGDTVAVPKISNKRPVSAQGRKAKGSVNELDGIDSRSSLSVDRCLAVESTAGMKTTGSMYTYTAEMMPHVC